MKTVVITGSTRGIGFGLARSFLELNCGVVVSGRLQEAVDRATGKLAAAFGAERVAGCPCDVTDFAQLQALWETATARFGQVDIWINNAGLGNPLLPLWEHSPERIRAVVTTNLLGAHFGSKVALAGMLKQGFGSLYNMEGFGSTGRTMPGMTLYGSTKYAIGYLSRSLAAETRHTPIVVGSLSPGMTLTDMILSETEADSVQRRQATRILNILGDRVETVTPFLARKMLANTKTGVRFAWLTPPKIFLRFLLAPIRRRDIFAGPEAN